MSRDVEITEPISVDSRAERRYKEAGRRGRCPLACLRLAWCLPMSKEAVVRESGREHAVRMAKARLREIQGELFEIHQAFPDLNTTIEPTAGNDMRGSASIAPRSHVPDERRRTRRRIAGV